MNLCLRHWQVDSLPLSHQGSPTYFNLVQSLSFVRLFAAPWTAACQASLSITNSQSLLRLKSVELVMPSSHLILCPPLLLQPSIFPSKRVFSNESVLPIKWSKYRSFSISPSNEYLGLVSFRIWSCSPRDSQESPPTPQFKSINSLVLSKAQPSYLKQEIFTFWPPSYNSPLNPPPLVSTNLLFFYEFFVCFLKHNWPTMLCWFLVHNIVIWYFYTLQNSWFSYSDLVLIRASQVVFVVKYLPTNAGDIRDADLIIGSGKSPGAGHGNPLQYSCLENPMDREAWWATVHTVAKSQRCLKWFNTYTLQPWWIIYYFEWFF